MNPAGGGVNIGTLPPGAIVTSTNVIVTSPFNDATSAAVNVGFSGNGTDLVSAGNLAANVTTVTTAPIAAMQTSKAATAATGTPVYVTVNRAGTLATTGAAAVIVTFHPDYANGTPGIPGS
jgi:hypothetical protein